MQLVAQLKQEVDEEQALWVTNRETHHRLSVVSEQLAQKCRDGEVSTYCRFESGGMLMPMLPSDWNVEWPLAAFVTRGGYERWFLSVSPPRKSFVYVFFDRAELASAIELFQGSPLQVEQVELGQLSPFLQLAVKIALKRGYLAGRSIDKRATREAEVRDAWAEALPDVPMTNANVEMIASVMGFPDIAAIRHGLRSGGVKK